MAPDEDEEGLTTTYVQLAGVVGAVVLLIVIVIAVVVVSGDEEEPPAAAPPSASALPSSAAAAPPPPPGSPPATPTVTPAPWRPRWRGTLTVRGPRARRDLDQVPPRTSTAPGEPDIRGDWLVPILEGESGVQLAVLPQGERPDAEECRQAALTEGVTETERLREGDVVCALTSQGTVARLITTHASQTSTSPRLEFDAVIWAQEGA